MQQEIFFAQNVKCGGCAGRIREGLTNITGIHSVNVDIPTGKVSVEGEQINRRVINQKLAELGYPEKPA